MDSYSPGHLAHLELHTANGARACAFYTELLGWRPERIEAGGRSYVALDLGNGMGGGVVECGAKPSLWLPYVSVPEINRTTERAVELGASVMLGPREGPGGWRSVVRAPDAGEIAFWQSKERYDASSAKR
jgi:predicted enzyme related to lactoylglutathione lyase